jgi:outer membrane immunogenic protein
MKRNLFLQVVILSMSTLSASEGGCSAFDGCYLGGSIGGSATTSHASMGIGINDPASSIVADQVYLFDSDYLNGALDGTFFAGYGASCHCFYMGFEGFLRASPNRLKMSQGDSLSTFGGSTTFALSETARSRVDTGDWHYGFDVRPGFLLDPCTLLYGRAGVEWSRVKLSGIVAGQVTSPTTSNIFNAFATGSHSKVSPHLRLGFGIEKRLCSNLALRTDYIYTDYGRISMSAYGTTLDGGGNVASISEQVKTRLRNYAVSVGLSYYFCPVNNCCSINCCSPSYIFSGPYLAGVMGGALLNSRINSTIQNFVDDAVGDTAQLIDNNPSSKLETLTFTGALCGGFGFARNSLYIGLEGFLQYSNPSGKQFDTTHPGSSGISHDGEVLILQTNTKGHIYPLQGGVSIRPGVVVSPTILFYGVLGSSVARLKAKNTTFAFADYTARGLAVTSATSKASASSLHASLRLGAGLEYAFRPKWHLRCECLFDNYGTVSINKPVVTQVPGPSGLTITQTLTPDINVRFRTISGNIGLARYF